ncbi:MAG: hypothetical protein HUU37_07435 [Bdellovibrionales bacterium]|nr:hypothetical protein [Bdellovibrionales bacterium]
MNTTTLGELKKHLRAGKTYRRADLAQWSKSVDRHLQALVQDGSLKKLRAGLYYCPKKSVFGEVPADDHELVRTFLKDDRFLLTSPNAYNALGLGTTQLYNRRVVYNHKRHGEFVLGGRTYEFRVKHHFPRQAVTEEFLLVDLMNNLGELAEDQDELRARAREKALSMDSTRLKRAVHEFASASAKKFFAGFLDG